MKKLELQFENQEGKTVTISLDQPIEPADPTVISAAMDTIIEADSFYSAGGGLVAKKAARIVERNVVDIDLEMAE